MTYLDPLSPNFVSKTWVFQMLGEVEKSEHPSHMNAFLLLAIVLHDNSRFHQAETLLACMRACVHACVRAYVYVCACTCVRARARLSRALSPCRGHSWKGAMATTGRRTRQGTPRATRVRRAYTRVATQSMTPVCPPHRPRFIFVEVGTLLKHRSPTLAVPQCASHPLSHSSSRQPTLARS